MLSRDADSSLDETPVGFSVPDITETEIAAVTRVLRSGWLMTGSESQALESELAAFLGVPHVVAVSSCTAALEIAYAHLRLPAGARVGVPTWTFVSTALAALHRGGHPVLLDVDPGTVNLAPEALQRALERDRLDAVIGVHLGGTPMDPAIHQLCAQAGVPLIEDAAHALGARDHRGLVAGQGTAGCCYSFYATKNLTSAEGGALATDDPELAAFAESFRLHGLDRDAWSRYRGDRGGAGYDVVGDGLKANLPDVLASLARVQLGRFDVLQERRRELVERYRSQLGDIPGLELVPSHHHPGSADHLMMVLLPHRVSRTAVQGALADAGIGSSVHFQPLHTFGWFVEQGIEPQSGGVPVADRLAPRALSLPLHTQLTDHQVDRVVKTLAAACAGSQKSFACGAVLT